MKYSKLFAGLCYASLAWLPAGVHAQQAHFSLQGTMENMKLKFPKLYLVYDSAVTHAPDSAVVTGNTYVFEGNISQPCLAYIMPAPPSPAGTVNGKPRLGQPKAAVFLSNGKITAVSRIELENIVVKGSQPHNDFLQCDSFMQGVNTRTAGIRMLAAETDLDMLLQNSVSAAILPMGEKQTADKLAFLQQHPASAVNPWLIWSLLMGDVKTGVAATLQSGYAQMPAALQNSETGVKAGALLTEELKAVVGGRAPAFEQPDTEGHLVSLASFTGKYLLLDFWSSTNPAQPTHYAYLKQAYAAYKSKGLEVLSVSLDKDSAAFKTGLQAFRFAWGNIDVFNEKGASVALLYGISVPLKNVLIGPDGTIVAKNISASKMGETLAALLD